MNADLFSAVRPKGWLGERLKNICNPRKHRWNAYLRACKRIPAISPVYGSTSWAKINERRGFLIEEEIRAHAKTGRSWREKVMSEELKALQAVAGEAWCGSLVAQNFLLARTLRRLKAENAQRRRLATAPLVSSAPDLSPPSLTPSPAPSTPSHDDEEV